MGRKYVLRHGKSIPGVTHGTASGYRDGCGCELCLGYHREKQVAARSRAREKAKADPSILVHGSQVAYNYYDCRCQICRTAESHRRLQRKIRTGK